MAITLRGSGTSTFSNNITSTTGDLTLSDGNLVVADGHGIDFSADEGANASDSLLADYEQGTWTPVLGVTDGNSTHTQQNQLGNYIKIGKLVYVWGRAELNALGNNGTGVISMNGLPYAARTSAQVEAGPKVIQSNGFTTNFVPQGTTINTNSTRLTFRVFGDADRERVRQTAGPGRYTASCQVILSGAYYTD